MILGVEREQQRVAAELQQAAALLVGDTEHARKDVVQDLGQLLRPDSTPARQALGERGESGDVDEATRRVETAPTRAGRVEVPLGRDPRKIRQKSRVHPGRSVRGHP